MDGILLLNKPVKMTSHDCVNKIRKLFNTRKVGHLGTLDPDVTGVLPICINEATKIIPFIEAMDKEYIATVSIGYSTDTEDESGRIIEVNQDYKEITRERLLNILNSFIGEQIQVPPMYSSVKVNGKKLYEYARNNIEVKRPERLITIYDIKILSDGNIFTGTEINFSIRVHCSKGTYIRTLAVDIGKKLGYPAHMKSLVRTKSGHFSLNQCVTFEDIEKGNFQLISLFDCLKDYHRVLVDDELKKKIIHGQKLHYTLDQFTLVVFYDIFNRVLAIYEKDTNYPQLIKPVRVLSGE